MNDNARDSFPARKKTPNLAFDINPVGLYSREGLKRALDGVMKVETFLHPLRPYLRSLYRKAFWGGELIEAIETARMAVAESATRPEIQIAAKGGRPAKRNRLDPGEYTKREERTA